MNHDMVDIGTVNVRVHEMPCLPFMSFVDIEAVTNILLGPASFGKDIAYAGQDISA